MISLGYNNVPTKNKQSWKDAMIDHIDLAINLHEIQEIIIMDHMECRAYKFIYEDKIKNKKDEYNFHIQNLRLLKNISKINYKNIFNESKW